GQQEGVARERLAQRAPTLRRRRLGARRAPGPLGRDDPSRFSRAHDRPIDRGERGGAPPTVVSLTEGGVRLRGDLLDGRADSDGAVAELLPALAELLLERSAADDRHGRGVAQAVGDRLLVVLDLLAEFVELCRLEGRGGRRQA